MGEDWFAYFSCFIKACYYCFEAKMIKTPVVKKPGGTLGIFPTEERESFYWSLKNETKV